MPEMNGPVKERAGGGARPEGAHGGGDGEPAKHRGGVRYGGPVQEQGHEIDRTVRQGAHSGARAMSSPYETRSENL
jgi:hypothetical protein